ncbi:MAG: ribosome biogenesis GTPase Der [Bacillales bacterium]
MSVGYVALVGSPSTGKSTIFNRIIGEKKSITEEERGITRDRIYGKANWLTKDFVCIDTGGIEIENAPFQEQIRIQAQIAIDEADVILFVCDGKIGVTNDDRLVAKILRDSNKPVVLAVNKIDNKEMLSNIYDFYALGIGEPIAVSGAHGIGIGDILDDIVKSLPEDKSIIEESIKFSLIGRPNVGKSSLTNAILKEERTIVSNISGTTRDSIDTSFKYNDNNYTIIDTAGLKKRGKIYESVDKFAAIRALKAIENSDICLLVIDANDGIIEQDKHVVGYAIENKKAIIVIVNKWDLVSNKLNKDEFIEKLRKEFKFLDYAPILFTSAVKHKNTDEIIKTIDKVYESYTYNIKTSSLNEIVHNAQLMNETPNFNGGRIKIYYSQQIKNKPVTIALFVNDPNWMHFSYLRYIENNIRKSFELIGSPINIVLRKRK